VSMEPPPSVAAVVEGPHPTVSGGAAISAPTPSITAIRARQARLAPCNKSLVLHCILFFLKDCSIAFSRGSKRSSKHPVRHNWWQHGRRPAGDRRIASKVCVTSRKRFLVLFGNHIVLIVVVDPWIWHTIHKS
jgi:hypothetical protein